MFPGLIELRRLERKTLLAITQIGEFARLGQIQRDANTAARTIDERRGRVDVHLGFNLNIRLRGDKGRGSVPRRIDIGALVEPTTDNKSVRNASYSLLICKAADPATSPIVRKVHFDYEPLEFRNSAEPKPSVHMQICGKLSRHHLAAGYLEQRLSAMYPSWEKPRIPLHPTSIALLLNWLFLEFEGDPVSQALLRNHMWRSLVADAERTVLLPYFKEAAAFLISTDNKPKRFLQAHLYGLSD